MRRGPVLYISLAAVLILTTFGALSLGSVPVPLSSVFGSLASGLGIDAGPVDDVHRTIVLELRLPRVLLAMLVGGGLAIIGVGMQTLVRNPLAEPYILGVSSGAAVGASLFYLGMLPAVISRAVTMPIAAFVGALGAIGLVVIAARTRAGISTPRLLLAGVAVSAMLAAVTSFITLTSPEPERIRGVLFWLLGSFSGARWSILPFPVVCTAAGLIAMIALSRPLDALLTGEEPARSLGISVETLKALLVLLSALVTGVLVAFSGIIGFVGLIVPHAVRFLSGVSHQRLIPAAFLTGAVFMAWVDVVARSIMPPQEIPVGIITAICGVPFFLVLLRRFGYS